VNRVFPHAQCDRDRANAFALAAQQHSLITVEYPTRPAELLILSSRPFQAGYNTLTDDVALQLGYGTNHRENHLSHGCGYVYRLTQTDEVNAHGLKFF
jgi:hypothetical protein